MNEQDNLKAALAFYDAWNMGDLSQLGQYEAEGFTSHGPGAPGEMNAEQNRVYEQTFLDAFPGSKFEVLQTISQGDLIVVNWKASGAHNGPLQTPSSGAIPPTGKMVDLYGSTTFQLKDGKITHSWNFWDMSSLLIQIGLMPPM